MIQRLKLVPPLNAMGFFEVRGFIEKELLLKAFPKTSRDWSFCLSFRPWVSLR